METNGDKRLIQLEWRWLMFKLDPKAYKGNPTTELIAKVVHEIGHMFDVLSPKILENRTRIMALEQKIKDLENKNDR